MNRTLLNDLTVQGIESGAENEQLQVAIDNVAMYLQKQEMHPIHQSPEEAGLFLGWIARIGDMLRSYQFVTHNPSERAAFIKEIFRVDSIINTRRKQTTIPSTPSYWNGSLEHIDDMFNSDKVKQMNSNIEQP